MNLSDYIFKKYITQAAFARAQNVSPAQVSQWLAKEFIVVGGVLYSPRRGLN